MEQKNENAELKKMLLEVYEQSLKNEIKVKSVLSEIKSLIEKLGAPFPCSEVRKEWIPRDELKKYLQFGDTQMSAITKKYKLTYSEIGKRRFFQTASIQKVLEIYKKN
jgi:hypothetical protein